MSRFRPHPKNPGILVGKTYQIPNYKKPWDIEKAMREEMKKIQKTSEGVVNRDAILERFFQMLGNDNLSLQQTDIICKELRDQLKETYPEKVQRNFEHCGMMW